MHSILTKTPAKLLFLAAALSEGSIREQLSGAVAESLQDLADEVENFAEDVVGKDDARLDLEGGTRVSAMMMRVLEFSQSFVVLGYENSEEVNELFDRMVAAKFVPEDAQNTISELPDDPAEEDDSQGIVQKSGTTG